MNAGTYRSNFQYRTLLHKQPGRIANLGGIAAQPEDWQVMQFDIAVPQCSSADEDRLVPKRTRLSGVRPFGYRMTHINGDRGTRVCYRIKDPA
jgi:hypothetical protein